jgi:hypothetical protein
MLAKVDARNLVVTPEPLQNEQKLLRMFLNVLAFARTLPADVPYAKTGVGRLIF